MIIQNKPNKILEINRNVYGLIGMMVIIFILIVMAMEMQLRENNQMNLVANDYHLLTSEKALTLLNAISTLRLRLKDQEIARLNKNVTAIKITSSTTTFPLFSTLDKMEAFKYECKKIIAEIDTIQVRYANPEFESVKSYLLEIHSSVLTNMEATKADKFYSSQRIDDIIMPLISVTHQLQRLHHLAYKKLQQDISDSKTYRKIQVISLITLLIIIGLFGITRMLWHVRYSLNALKESQIKLQDENEFVSGLLNTVPVIVLLLNEKGCIQYVNPYFEKLTGFHLDEIKGKDWFDTFIPDGCKNDIRQLFQKTLQQNSVKGNVNTIINRDGNKLDVEWYAQTMQQYDGKSMLTSVLCTGQDITDRNRSERELEQYRFHLEELVAERTNEMKVAVKNAENANKAKSEFLSSMSHELRTPMNAVLGFSQLLVTDTDSLLTKDQLESVEMIIEGGEHLLSLINDVLDLSKIEAGNSELKIESINIKTLISEVYLLVQPQAEQQSISLDNKITEEVDYKILADYRKLKQVMLNFSSNAIKYNSDQGILTYSCDRSNNKIRLSVSDTGDGVTEELLPSLFEPFNRLDKANSTIQGTGIGLTICKNLVELMGGEIGVFMNPGKGLTFWVEFEESLCK